MVYLLTCIFIWPLNAKLDRAVRHLERYGDLVQPESISANPF